MRTLAGCLLFSLCTAGAVLQAGTPGVFEGLVVQPAQGGEAGWLYVQSRNGSVRRVAVMAAEFVYGDEVPPRERQSSVPRRLPAGTRVRVTAEQGKGGEWRATRVEIVRGPPRAGTSSRVARPFSKSAVAFEAYNRSRSHWPIRGVP